jgi:hypothetical protein
LPLFRLSASGPVFAAQQTNTKNTGSALMVCPPWRWLQPVMSAYRTCSKTAAGSQPQTG